MKATTFFILLIFLTLGGCSSDNYDNNTGGLPEIEFLLYELLKQDGSSFEFGEIEVSGQIKVVDILTGEVWQAETINWSEMDIDPYYSDAAGKPLFAKLNFAGGWEHPDEAGGHGNVWLEDKFYLLRYQGAETDTIRIRDSTKVGVYNYYTFYLNEVKQEPNTVLSREYLSIQKEGF